MPKASFTSEATKKAFYEKNNKKIQDKYYEDAEFREKKLADRRALYYKHKALGIGRFARKVVD